VLQKLHNFLFGSKASCVCHVSVLLKLHDFLFGSRGKLFGHLRLWNLWLSGRGVLSHRRLGNSLGCLMLCKAGVQAGRTQPLLAHQSDSVVLVVLHGLSLISDIIPACSTKHA